MQDSTEQEKHMHSNKDIEDFASLNHDQYIDLDKNQYVGRGQTRFDAIRDLISILKAKKLYDHYRYTDPCQQHNMNVHMLIRFTNGNMSYITFAYNNDLWSSSVRTSSLKTDM